jgi:hypothetical protein
MLVQAAYANRLRTRSKPLLFYGIGILGLIVSWLMRVSGDSNVEALAVLLLLASLTTIIAGSFSMKNALEEYYAKAEPINLQLSAGMTFFFGPL